MISRYMVLVASEQKLLMMRPYQIYAVKAIVECIHQNCGNGYIWHTTGSGKTLTSFKASTLLKDNPDIDKCLFVVDRKDLDRQTREEFNRFQEGCVEENTNTEALVRRLLSDDYADKVIVTTIQKLGLALDSTAPISATTRSGWSRCADLASRSSSTNATARSSATTTRPSRSSSPTPSSLASPARPSFEKNASYQQIEGEQASFRTTDDLFQRCLHQYTITHAIEDRNVLRFHVDYFKPEGKNPPKPGEGMKNPVIETILTKHDAATNGRKFNAVLATSQHQRCHRVFRTIRRRSGAASRARYRIPPLNIACVFSPARRRQQGRAADSGRPAARKGRQPAGP
jgi:type I restriction enzyme R subunit